MLRPTLMKHVRLLVLTDDLPRASLALARTENFHPDPRPPMETRLRHAPAHTYRERYTQARGRLESIRRLLDAECPDVLHDVHEVGLQELTRLNEQLGVLAQQAGEFAESRRQLDEAEHLLREQLGALADFAELDINLGLLHRQSRFLDFHVGLVPRENLAQLQGAVELAQHLLHVYRLDESFARVVIVGATGTRESRLASVLAAAGFQRLSVPQGLDRTPAQMREELTGHHAQLVQRRTALEKAILHWGQQVRESLCAAAHTLRLAEPLVILDPSIHSEGLLAYLAGWVPTRAVEDLRARLAADLTGPFDLAVRAPRADERSLVPTVPVRSRLLAPFAMLVKQYGIPEYGEVDPTPWFAITFLLMFGSMFGDLGQGAVIALTAFALRRKLGRFWPFGLLAGLSSMFFGLLFGSVFGYEHVLPALWMSPLHDPLRMLALALAWGVFFLTVACLLAIYNRAAVGNWPGALFGPNGLVHLVFYLSLIAGGVHLGQGQAFGIVPIALILAALGALAAYNWRHLDAPRGERVLVIVIETLETIIGSISNTLSFLRVAAFSLNHVALSIAVFTLADMMGRAGHITTVVLGNLFILVLEGGIVMIQVMRLQYYEGFSRYFSGEGHEFTPLRLRRD